jgi:hypothetical protein
MRWNRVINILLFAALGASGTLPAMAYVNCEANHVTSADETVCWVPGLRNANQEVRAAYEALALRVADVSALRSNQTSWKEQILDTCDGTDCMETALAERAQQLRNALERVAAPPAAPMEQRPGVTRQPEQFSNLPRHAAQQLEPSSPTESRRPRTAAQERHNTVPAQSVEAPKPSSDLPSSGSSRASTWRSTWGDALVRYGSLALFINCLVAIVMHVKGTLTIYRDYTDAAFTGCAPLVALVASWLLSWIGLPDAWATAAGWLVLSGMAIFVLSSSLHNNPTRGTALISFFAKVTMIAFVYGLLLLMLGGGNSERGKHERRDYHAARQQREFEKQVVYAAIVAAAAAALSAWLCRERRFSPLNEYFQQAITDDPIDEALPDQTV